MSEASKATVEEEFDWFQLSLELQDPNHEEFSEKLWRKVKSNPFVPIGVCQPDNFVLFPAEIFNDSFRIAGALGACAALGYGLVSMRRNDKRMSQLMVCVADRQAATRSTS